MGKLIAISAVLHVAALLIVPHVPAFGRHYELAYDVYSVDLVDLSSGAAEQGPEEIAVPEDELQAPPKTTEKTEETIPEEPVKHPKQIAVKPQTTKPAKSLRERIAERLEKQDEKRPATGGTGSGSQGTTPRASGAGSGSRAGRASISAGKFPYSWYLSVIQGKVTSNWEQPSARLVTEDALTVLVSFRIKRDGSLDALTVRRPSGRSTLDQSATKAVRDSAPFPPLPTEYREGYLDVTIEFTVTRE
jgi:TonB family protein